MIDITTAKGYGKRSLNYSLESDRSLMKTIAELESSYRVTIVKRGIFVVTI